MILTNGCVYRIISFLNIMEKLDIVPVSVLDSFHLRDLNLIKEVL